MNNKIVINEYDFGEFAKCGLRLFGESTYQPLEELQIAEEMWTWISRERFQDKIPSIRDIRDRYEGFSASFDLDEQAARRCARAGVRICKHLNALSNLFDLVQPVSNYELPFARATVQGQYSAGQLPRKASVYIIRLHLKVPTFFGKNRQPDIINMSRYLHLRTFEPGIQNVRIYNYTLLDDTAAFWSDVYEDSAVRSMLASVAYSLTEERLFPSPGPYCDTCQTGACLQAFNLRRTA